MGLRLRARATATTGRPGCTQFRYGQCNQQVATVGRIACRVVSCDPAVLVVGNCAPTVAVDNSTANHNKPCLQEKALEEDDVEHGMAVDVMLNPNDPTSGYTLDRWGGIHPFGGAVAVQTASFWPGQDVARQIVVIDDWVHGRGLRDGPRRRAAPVRRCATGHRRRRTGRGGKIVPFSEL